MTSHEPSETLRSLLAGAGPILVLTGAGVSAESGLSTFRGPEGLWEGKDPMTVATPEAFRDDPEEVWRFYAHRRFQAAAASPNPAHRAIAALEKRRGEGMLLVTQNVDGLHERSGSTRIVRLHGSLWILRCTVEGTETEDHRQDLTPLPPRCDCGAILRPGVVWFGETLPVDAFAAAEAAARRAALAIVAGTSSMVYPAAGLPRAARSAGAYVVEVNPEITPLTPEVDEHLRGPAGTVLPLLASLAGATIEGAR